MDTVSIEEVARELGIKSQELIRRIDKLSPEALFLLNIKSGKSIITVKMAEDIFDAVLNNKKEYIEVRDRPIHFKLEKINLYFAHTPIDIEFVKRFASIYKIGSTEHFMIRSFNFSEMDIVRCFTAGLLDINIARYINNRTSKKDLFRLIENLNKVLDDIEVENIDESNPLEKLEIHIAKHNPEAVYLEGIDFAQAQQYSDVFKLIRKLTHQANIRFEISFVNLPKECNRSVNSVVSYFK